MIYADNNGSCPLKKEIQDYLNARWTSPLGNPNAIHKIGQELNLGIEKCRGIIAKAFGAKNSQIIFNSGASEGISHIYHHVMLTSPKEIIISSPIEHSSVEMANQFYQSLGKKIIYLKVNHNGIVNPLELEELLKQYSSQVALVSVMAANNETGVIQPYKQIAELTQKFAVPYLCDTTQYIGKAPFHFNESGIDYAVCSGHKLGALTGTGFILVKNPSTLTPLVFGGGQERGLRGGTQNYIGIETLALASQICVEEMNLLSDLKSEKEKFEKSLKEKIPGCLVIGEKEERVASTTLLSCPGIHGQGIQIELESQDIFVTTSSACSDNEPRTSRVLQAMGIDDTVGRSVIRISLCPKQIKKYHELEEAILKAVHKLKKIASF